MSKISLSPSPTGSAVYTIASPAGSTDRTLTLPDATATLFTNAGGTLTGGLTVGTLGDLIVDTTSTAAVVTVGRQSAVGSDNTNFRVRNRVNATAFFVNAGDRTAQVATTFGVGDATPSSSGAGITFPATQNASANANTLDDYEEGTWTPTIGASSTNPTGLVYSIQQGGYTKIGNVVYIRFRVGFSFSGGTGSGSIQILGLPFTATNGVIHPRTTPQQDNITFTGFAYLDIGANNGATNAGIAKCRSGSTAASVLIGDCASGGTDINGGFFYFV